MKTSPYITKRQLLDLIADGWQIDVVSLAAPHKTAAVWYGEWVIQVPEQRGEPERFLISASNLGTPKLRTCKTANGLISLMQELGFEEITIPMEKGESAPHRLHSPNDHAFRDLVEESEAEETHISVQNGLRFVFRHGFLPVKIALAVIEAGYARPIALHIQPDGDYRHTLDAIRLTETGQAAAKNIETTATVGFPSPDSIPDWQRVVTEDYIRTKASEGISANRIICAKGWYTGSETPDHQLIAQPPVQRRLRRRPWAHAKI